MTGSRSPAIGMIGAFDRSSSWGQFGSSCIDPPTGDSCINPLGTTGCDSIFSPVGKLGPGKGQDLKSGRDGR